MRYLVRWTETTWLEAHVEADSRAHALRKANAGQLGMSVSLGTNLGTFSAEAAEPCKHHWILVPPGDDHCTKCGAS